MLDDDQIILGDNLDVLPRFDNATFQLIYVDPPFNTGKPQTRKTLETVPDEVGDRTGFAGRRYKTKLLANRCISMIFDDYLGFLAPRLEQARRLSLALARCTSISTIAKRITASSCSTRSLDASASSTRSSGPMTTGRDQNAGGPQSTTRTLSTSSTRRILLQRRGG